MLLRSDVALRAVTVDFLRKSIYKVFGRAFFKKPVGLGATPHQDNYTILIIGREIL
jgi:hypothetical protein